MTFCAVNLKLNSFQEHDGKVNEVDIKVCTAGLTTVQVHVG